MKQNTINHKRLTAIVRQEASNALYRLREYQDAQKREPDGELARVLKAGIIEGVTSENVDGILKEYVTVNDQFLSLVGYDGNLDGFLADYFGTDYKPEEGEPLRFRFIGGFLVNPTIISKSSK